MTVFNLCVNVLIYNHILLQTSNFSFKFQQWYSEHASQSDGSFVTFCQQSMIRKPPCTWGYVNPHLIHGSVSQLESWTQTTSWSVQHFLQAYYCDRPTDHDSWSVTLFHRRTRTAYVYNGCLVWYNVVLTPWNHSSVKYSQLGQSANICDVSNQPTRTLYMYKKSQWQQINIYPNWLYCTLEWYVELTICHTTPDISCTELLFTNCDYNLTTKATFCQLPTTYCFHCHPCSCNTLRLCKSPQFAKAATNKTHHWW